MVGRTNVSIGGGGGSAFLAYLQVATDPNAVITAVNLAGDTFSGVADNTGSLVINITAPGTYTVTETDGGVATIAIIDYGVTYSVEVYSFDGMMIEEGVALVPFESYMLYGSTLPTVITMPFGSTTALFISMSDATSQVAYRTEEAYDISNYNTLKFFGSANTGVPGIYAYDENNNGTWLGNVTQYGEKNVALTSLDKTKKYKFGFYVDGTNSIIIIDMMLL